jgi:hypothetical protein
VGPLVTTPVRRVDTELSMTGSTSTARKPRPHEAAIHNCLHNQCDSLQPMHRPIVALRLSLAQVDLSSDATCTAYVLGRDIEGRASMVERP